MEARAAVLEDEIEELVARFHEVRRSQDVAATAAFPVGGDEQGEQDEQREQDGLYDFVVAQVCLAWE